MGLSSSQTRYLFLASEMHNINLQVQNIENQKILLATQQDEVYENYCNALDQTRLQVRYYDDITSKNVDATFSTMCDYTDSERAADYRLISNKTGKLYVDSSVAEAYNTYKNDKYMFAWAAMGFDPGSNGSNGDMCWGYMYDENGQLVTDSSDRFGQYVGINGDAYNTIEHNVYMTGVEEYVYNLHASKTSKSDIEEELVEKYAAVAALEQTDPDNIDQDKVDEQTEALAEFREYLYKNYSEEIFNQVVTTKNDVPGNTDVQPEYRSMTWSGIQDQFEYYLDLYDQIKEVGGCEGLDKEYQSGSAGIQWLNNMVQGGLVTLQVNQKSGTQIGWTTISVSTDLNLAYANSDEDEAKAEAIYERDLKTIENKETRLDNLLKKFETTYEADKTELDSLKQIMDDNIKRTMNIFNA